MSGYGKILLSVACNKGHLGKSLQIRCISNCAFTTCRNGIQNISKQTSTSTYILSNTKKSNLIIPVRYTNFFNKHTSDQLWKGVTSVSNQGAKKGRGRGRKIRKNLNRGQIIGEGDQRAVFPGLNAPVILNQDINRHRVLEPNPQRREELIRLRDSMLSRRSRAIHPLERGWSGTKWGGRLLGPPDPVGEEVFEGFQSVCLEFKIVTHMTGLHGRKRSFSALCVTGNGQGLAGFALAKSTTGMGALKLAKNKAAQQLVYINRYEDHSVMHDFYTEFCRSRIFVKKMHKGYGLVCHRAIRSICQMFGISDLHAKVEASINIQNLTKAFFLGLLRQKSYQDLANEKRLHLVEFRKENNFFPRVMASPTDAPVRTLAEISPNENLDVSIHCMDDQVPLVRKKFPPFYVGTKGYETYLRKYQHYRNVPKVKKELYKEYGDVKSFYFDQYPECINNFYHHYKDTANEEEDEGGF